MGILINFIGILLLFAALTTGADVAELAPGMIFYGIGAGFVSAQIANISLSAVATTEAGEASGVNATVRQLGSSLGSAIIGTVFIAALTSGLTAGVNASNVIPAPAKTSIVAAVEKDSSAFEYGYKPTEGQGPQNPALTAEMQRIVNDSTVDGARQGLMLAAIFIAGCFAISFTLPNVEPIHRGQKKMSVGH
jgi:hypothetical protein